MAIAIQTIRFEFNRVGNERYAFTYTGDISDVSGEVSLVYYWKLQSETTWRGDSAVSVPGRLFGGRLRRPTDDEIEGDLRGTYAENQVYDVWFGIASGRYSTRTYPQPTTDFNTLRDRNVLGWIQGVFDTAVLPYSIGQVSRDQLKAVIRVNYLPPPASATIYLRYRRSDRPNDPWAELTPQFASTATTLRFITPNLTPNRPYVAQVSLTPDYAVHLSTNFISLNLPIAGIIDPGRTFDQHVPFWRSIFGLSGYDLITGELPAGYIQPVRTNAEDLPNELNNLVQRKREIPTADLARELSKRTVAGSFEDNRGNWRAISKTLWQEQPIRGVFTTDKFRITERTLRAELRDRLSIKTVRAQVYRDNERTQFGDTDTTIVEVLDVEDNPIKAALFNDRTLDMSGIFTIITEVPGWSRENVALVAEDTPLIVLFDINGVLDINTAPSELHECQPGFNVQVELPSETGTTVYTGMLMNKRIRVDTNGKVTHTLTVWVHETVEVLDTFDIVWGDDVLTWGTERIGWNG